MPFSAFAILAVLAVPASPPLLAVTPIQMHGNLSDALLINYNYDLSV